VTTPQRIGILANASFRPVGDRIREWGLVAWGTDSTRDAAARISRAEVDVVLIEASVEFLSEEVITAAVRLGIPVFALDVDRAHSKWIANRPGLSVIDSIDEFRTALLDVINHEEPARTPLVIAVWGPSGAPGVTTTAISLAALATGDKRTVILCDADTRGASVSIALGLLDDVPGFAAAARLAGRGELSSSEISRLSLQGGRGKTVFSVLTGLPRSSRWSEIAPTKSIAVIDALVGMFDVVIVDVGSSIEENEWIDNAPQRDGAAREIIRRADVVVAVGSADAVGIARLIRGLDELSDMCKHPLVVLNRTNRGSASEARAALERFSSHSVAASVARDGRAGLDDALPKASAFAPVWGAVKVAKAVAV
jgi:Mrp family chromosome partitioning ATPase